MVDGAKLRLAADWFMTVCSVLPIWLKRANLSFPRERARARENREWKRLRNMIRTSADMSDIRRMCCKKCCKLSNTQSVTSS